jgi:hypothetical protein
MVWGIVFFKRGSMIDENVLIDSIACLLRTRHDYLERSEGRRTFLASWALPLGRSEVIGSVSRHSLKTKRV